MHNASSKIVLFWLITTCTALLIATSVWWYFSFIVPTPQQAASPPPTANNSEKKVPGKKNPTIIADNDKLDEVTSMPAPEGWVPYADSVLAIYIPADWKAEGGPTSSSLRDPGESFYTYSATFGTSDNNRERPCSFAVQSLAFLPSIEAKEGLDTGDDGKLTDPPGRIWTTSSSATISLTKGAKPSVITVPTGYLPEM
ncbi:hypothetical protein JNJ66_00850 [Candidatus Saccharibacteria bacterium]|nr:hypothetical protein [Candidatus Saccharibacteria bacterium]